MGHITLCHHRKVTGNLQGCRRKTNRVGYPLPKKKKKKKEKISKKNASKKRQIMHAMRPYGRAQKKQVGNIPGHCLTKNRDPT
jgi:hypothetical protein